MTLTQTKIGDPDANETKTCTIAGISFDSGLLMQVLKDLIHVLVTEGGGLYDDVIGHDGLNQGSHVGPPLEVDVVLGLVPFINARVTSPQG